MSLAVLLNASFEVFQTIGKISSQGLLVLVITFKGEIWDKFTEFTFLKF